MTGFESERKGNLLVRSNSALGPTVLNAMHQPWFLLRPPIGYGIIETQGEKERQGTTALPAGGA